MKRGSLFDGPSGFPQKASDAATIPGRCKDCGYWDRNEIRDTEFGACFKIRGVAVIKHESGFCDKWRGKDEL